jgi:hypothetical protein
MSSKLRRAAGALLILMACAIAGTGFLIGGASADAGSGPAARLAGEAARRKVEDAWNAVRGALEARVGAVATIPPLQAALNAHVDGHTLLDLFETEDWWRAVRDDFRSARLLLGGQTLVTQGKLDLGNADVALVAAALKDKVASDVVSVNKQAVVAIAARIPVQDDATPAPVLVLANPFDLGLVQKLADRTGQAVMLLSDAGASIAIAGSNEQQILVQGLLGREAQPIVADPHGHWVGALVELAPNLRLWTVQAVTIEGLPSRGGGLIPWMIAPLFLAVGMLLIVSRRQRPGMVAAQVEVDTTLRFGSTPARAQRRLESHVVNVAAPPRSAAPLAAAEPARSTSGAVTGPAATSDSRRNKTFGRYQLLDRLGQGGMADIYTAVANGVEGFTRTFVVKLLRPELARDKEAVSQFVDEARMQAGLVHSNIVPVFDFGVVNGEYFMTQEYILGRDMVRVVQRFFEHARRSMEPRYAYYVAHETLLALEYAHSKLDREGNPMGLVHRDVSAANIMMSLEGEVKLFDFGIVKAHGRSTQTQVGMVKGNTSFMSPEQARGQQVDRRSDLFSLALVMYYCLTGRLLYEGDNDLDVLYKAASGPTAQDWEALRQLSQPAPEILARALSINPAQRYQSAEAFARDLAPHINGVKSEAANLMQVLFGDELRREAA